MSEYGVAISGVAYSLPDMVIGNEHEIFEQIPDIPDNWWRFWGINSRFRVNEGDTELTLAVDACNKAMAASGISSADIDLVLANTTNFFLTPLDGETMAQSERKRIYPRLSYSLKHTLGTSNALCWEVDAACASFLFNLQLAANFIKQGRYRNVLVCSTERMSAMLDYTSKSSTTFGDGAAAAVLTRADIAQADLLASSYYSDSRNYQVATGRWRYPENLPLEQRRPDDFRVHFTLADDGQSQIAQMMPETVPHVTLAALNKAGVTSDDIAAFVFHQPSVVLVDTWARRLGISPERYITKVEDCGCLVSASVAVTLCETVSQGKLPPGSLMILAGAGAGWSFGAQVWRIDKLSTID